MVSPSEEEILTLGLSLTSSTNNKNNHTKPEPAHMIHEPYLTLSLSNDTQTNKTVEKPCSVSVASTTTFSHVVSVKRERESPSSDDDRRSSRISDADDEEDGSGPSNTTRKKLRLTKDQSALLEESFKHHSTLNPKQKQALADRLNLRPRQVEVWFQNRRARTKLKQTEVDCEYLKKWCETLTEENRRLEKELQELKAMKLGHPFYMHLPAATLTMCPSCERICNGVPISKGTTNNSTPSSKDAFALGPNKSLFYPPQQIRPLLVD